MAAKAQHASRKLLLKREAVVAAAGGAWAARQYVHEPPALTEQVIDKVKEKASEMVTVYMRKPNE